MRAPSQGLTLVEMLVALSVFSVIATSCLVIMRLGIDSDEQLAQAADLMTEFQVARSLIKRDLVQVTNRPVRDELGAVMPAPMVGGAFNFGSFDVNEANETLLMAMVSNGRVNPGDAYPQASLQYIEYRLVEDRIVRRVWAYLDRLEQTPLSEQVLFTDVDNVNVRFLDGALWTDQWRSRAGAVTPRVVELVFDHPVLGPINQLFFVESISA